MEVRLPDDAPPDSEFALEPPTDAPNSCNLKPYQLWIGVISSIIQAIRIPNLSTEPRTLKRHELFCQVIPVLEPKEVPSTGLPPAQHLSPIVNPCHSASVQVDPDSILPCTVRADFLALLREYDSIFDPQFPRYNGAAVPYNAKVNMGLSSPLSGTATFPSMHEISSLSSKRSLNT